MRILSARLESLDRIVLGFSGSPDSIHLEQVSFTPYLEVRELEMHGHSIIVLVADVDVSNNYTALVRGKGNAPVEWGTVLDEFVSRKALGCTLEKGRLVFRLFAPRGSSVHLHLFRSLDDEIGTRYELQRDRCGVWEISLAANSGECYYAYSIDGPSGTGEQFDPAVLVADPYGKAVATRNTFRHEAKTLLPHMIPEYDWENDRPVAIRSEDLVIYEMHIKDMTSHCTSRGKQESGTYDALAEKNRGGSVDYIASLGVNAVELLPTQQYASIEPPFSDGPVEGVHNNWNPYAANHWGYMTSYFFAPESRYSTGTDTGDGAWSGAGGSQVAGLKNMVREFHRRGIAVIMDVVYNHTSQYDRQPLKYIDHKYYFSRDEQGRFVESSGCGNDFDSGKPMSRRLIVDSILHWMREYHIDGFRFDLASIIDSETMLTIRDEARKLNPDVLLIAEPWGGGKYDPHGFSAKDIASWNDMFRNSVKGSEPVNGKGYIFGSWGYSSPEDFGKWILGSVTEKGGPYLAHKHSVNYLESHDGYTLADFIKIAAGEYRPGSIVTDLDSHVRLTDNELRYHRIAAFLLMISKGIVMFQAGQEFARSKVIAKRGLPGTTPGIVDHNSYEKDDETNWLNWDHAELNKDLLEYYRGLIAIRMRCSALRRAPLEAYRFLAADVPVASGFMLDCIEQVEEQSVTNRTRIAALVNANSVSKATYSLPGKGPWNVLVEGGRAGLVPLRVIEQDVVTLPPSSVMLLSAQS